MAKIGRKRYRECGSVAGYMYHKRSLKDEACLECKEAWMWYYKHRREYGIVPVIEYNYEEHDPADFDWPEDS